MTIHKINNLFSEQDLYSINELISSYEIPVLDFGKYVDANENAGTGVNNQLGRIQVGHLNISKDIINKMYDLIYSKFGLNLKMDHALYAEYSKKYGKPDLPPHYDHDTNLLVIDYQLDANTEWNLGVDFESYSLENNSALIFNANEHIHWRPHKKFKENEYVKMIFFRFFDPNNRINNEHLNFKVHDPIFNEVKSFRNSLNGGK